MSTSMDGEVLELQKVGSRQYAVSIHKNGALEVTMKNFNGMQRTVYEHINILDDASPTVNESSIDEGIELLMGTEAGKPDKEGNYPENSVHGKVMAKLNNYYVKSFDEPEDE